MLEISGKVQWSTLFLHLKTAIFIITRTMMDCAAVQMTISLVIISRRRVSQAIQLSKATP